MAIELVGVTKDFTTPRRRHARALDDVFLQVVEGSAVALMGPSGSGKSTLLHLVGGLDRPTEGQVLVDGRDVGALKGRALADHRRSVGFVFQRFNLIKGVSVLENVMLPAYPTGEPHAAVRQRALALLDLLGLAGKGSARVEWLSGGEAQRTAIARALINTPAVLIADEPTAHLDTTLSREFMDSMGRLKARGTTILIAIHDPLVRDAPVIDRIVEMRDGRLVAGGEQG